MCRVGSSWGLWLGLAWQGIAAGWEVTPTCPSLQLDIMEPKVPDDIYKTHLENNSECSFNCHVMLSCTAARG